LTEHDEKINAKEGSELTNRYTIHLHASRSQVKQASKKKIKNSNETLIFVVVYDKLSNTIWYFKNTTEKRPNG